METGATGFPELATEGPPSVGVVVFVPSAITDARGIGVGEEASSSVAVYTDIYLIPLPIRRLIASIRLGDFLSFQCLSTSRTSTMRMPPTKTRSRKARSSMVMLVTLLLVGLLVHAPAPHDPGPTTNYPSSRPPGSAQSVFVRGRSEEHTSEL